MEHQSDQSGAGKKEGLGAGAKVGIGCGSGCLVLVVIFVIAGVFGWQWVRRLIGQYEAEFASLGMAKGDAGQMLTVTTAPQVPTYYTGQVVTLDFSGPVAVKIGVLGQDIRINRGEFAGDVVCRGQVVRVSRGVKIAGVLDVKCQMVQDQGAEIAGGITGSFQMKQ